MFSCIGWAPPQLMPRCALRTGATAVAGLLRRRPAVGPAGVGAEACPGAGAGLPYAATVLVGHRAEGVLRFPEAVAVDDQGDVYVADQLSYVVQKFSPRARLRPSGAPSAAGTASSGRRVALPRMRRATSTWSTPSHNRIEKFDLGRRIPDRMGPQGQRARRLLRLLPGLHPPARRGDRRGGELRVRGRQRQRPHRALQPDGRGSDGMGHAGKRPRPVLLPPRGGRQRKRGDRQRRRQPPHREVRPGRRLPGRSRRLGKRTRAVRLSLRRRPRRRR